MKSNGGGRGLVKLDADIKAIARSIIQGNEKKKKRIKSVQKNIKKNIKKWFQKQNMTN